MNCFSSQKEVIYLFQSTETERQIIALSLCIRNQKSIKAEEMEIREEL